MNNTTELATALSQATSNSTQNWMLLISILSGSVMYLWLFRHGIKRKIIKFTVIAYMTKYIKRTGRNLMVLNHGNQGFMGMKEMISMDDVMQMENILRKNDFSNTDIIVNTYGGDLMASIRMAKLLDGLDDVRVIVPKFAWSGGSLIALASNDILANRTSIFGAIDPQLGGLTQRFSAKDWNKITEKKNLDEVDDRSIGFASQSSKVMQEMKDYSDDFIVTDAVDREQFMDLFLTGDYSHSHVVEPENIDEIGFNIQYLDSEIPNRIVEKVQGFSGVLSLSKDSKTFKLFSKVVG